MAILANDGLGGHHNDGELYSTRCEEKLALRCSFNCKNDKTKSESGTNDWQLWALIIFRNRLIGTSWISICCRHPLSEIVVKASLQHLCKPFHMVRLWKIKHQRYWLRYRWSQMRASIQHDAPEYVAKENPKMLRIFTFSYFHQHLARL